MTGEVASGCMVLKHITHIRGLGFNTLPNRDTASSSPWHLFQNGNTVPWQISMGDASKLENIRTPLLSTLISSVFCRQGALVLGLQERGWYGEKTLNLKSKDLSSRPLFALLLVFSECCDARRPLKSQWKISATDSLDTCEMFIADHYSEPACVKHRHKLWIVSSWTLSIKKQPNLFAWVLLDSWNQRPSGKG